MQTTTTTTLTPNIVTRFRCSFRFELLYISNVWVLTNNIDKIERTFQGRIQSRWCVGGGAEVWRKSLTRHNINEKWHLYTSKYLSIPLTIRYFRMFADTIFLYHCELWSTTHTINNSIDAFQRHLLRYAIGIKYLKTISTSKPLETTKCQPWSITIEQRCLSWLGHVMRMDPAVPARQALQEALRPCKRNGGCRGDNLVVGSAKEFSRTKH